VPDLAPVALEALRLRITRVFPAQIRAAVEALDDEQIWWRPNESSNSVGNLIIHLSGSLNHYLNRNFGGIAYQRDRPAEFSERRQIPRAQLMAIFEDMVSKGEKTFRALSPERLAQTSVEPERYTLVIEDLLSVATHMANHAGQIVWIAKMLKEGVLSEVWMRSHKREGGWKR
jgi:hypothetical protein